MKKSIFIMLSLASTLNYAQKIEITAGVGAPSVQGIAYSIATDIASVIATGSTNTPDSQFVADIGVMMYNETGKWRFGTDVMFEGFASAGSISKQNFISILPKVDYMWLNPENKFQIYSGIGLGANFINTTYVDKNTNQQSTNTDTILGYNLTPIGLRYGKDFGIYLESNVGNKGLVQGGLSYRF